MNNNYNDDNDYNCWICKCGCGTKKIHKTKWAFISMYEKHNINNKKKQEIQTDNIKKPIETIETIEPIETIETIEENNSKILIPTIQYDNILKKNIVIMKPLQTLNNLLNKNDNDEKSQTTKSDKLIELRNLLHLDIL